MHIQIKDLGADRPQVTDHCFLDTLFQSNLPQI